MKTTCEALVIGGGPAGAVVAALLARAGWSVIVLERKSFPRRKVCGEYLSATNWPLLDELDLAETVAEQAGPDIRRVGLFVGNHERSAELPLPDGGAGRWGCALSRERLDTLLLERAAQWGADVWQPWQAESLVETDGGFVCRAASVDGDDTAEIAAPVVVAAHGSWDPGELPTQPARRRPHGGDLLGFKAHFRGTSLDADLMPLVCFPGGYGGLVHTDDDRVSFSCCIRRDRLERLPRVDGAVAGEAVRDHIEATTPAVRRLLADATIDGRWLSAGPIHPSIRGCYQRGIFLVGNAAGEAHPAVAEGITMALQSAKLLSERLAPRRNGAVDRAVRDAVARDYTTAWHACFARRMRASSAVAHWAMRPTLVRVSLPLIERFPGLLTWGARRCGKTDSRYLRTPALAEALPSRAPV